MKQIFLILLLTISTLSIAQNKEGIAQYDIVRKLEIKGMSGMDFDFPEETKSKRKLTFKDSISIFEVVHKERKVNQNSGFNFHFIEPENKLYIDRRSNVFKEKKDFMGKEFLIESQHEPIKWHKTSEIKKIGDYFCQLATFRDTSRTLHAWFTPQIQVSAGPEKFGDLPGLIVVLIVNEGKTVYNLKSIEFKSIDKVKAPKKGEKVTQEEYDKIIEEKMKRRGGVFEFYKDD